MIFDKEEDALNWYESQERVLTKNFLDTIPWKDVSNYELDEKFIPVLIYMRDIEKYTTVYYDELLRTPTGRDPIIRKFMDRWSAEESLHGDLLNRFLNETGQSTPKNWYENFKKSVKKNAFIVSRARHLITNCFGEKFSAVHMTWGAINELTTLTGYQRLWQLARHPTLEYILRAIAREEARHQFFYWSIARIKLVNSPFARKLARFIIKHFWEPVGQDAKTIHETNYLISTLFNGIPGVQIMDRQVNRRIEELPGFLNTKIITNRIAQAAIKV